MTLSVVTTGATKTAICNARSDAMEVSVQHEIGALTSTTLSLIASSSHAVFDHLATYDVARNP